MSNLAIKEILIQIEEKKPDRTRTTIHIDREHLKYLKKKKLDLSKLVRRVIEAMIKQERE